MQPSIHLVQIPDIGETLLERLNVPVDSFEFGLLKFIFITLNHVIIMILHLSISCYYTRKHKINITNVTIVALRGYILI